MSWLCPDFADLPDNLRWHAVRLKPNEKVRGVIAGTVMRAPIHFTGKSHPCCRIMTDGKLPCYCDDHQCGVRVMGYVPIITEERERVVVTVSAVVAEKVRQLAVGAPVEAAHPGIKNRPIKCYPLASNAINQSVLRKITPSHPFDITEYLLHLWQCRALTEHIGYRFRPSGKTLGRNAPPDAA